MAMYISTICATDEDAQKAGVTLLSLVTTQDHVPSGFQATSWEVVRSSSPVKVVRTAVAHVHDANKEALFDFLRFQRSKLLGFHSQVNPEEFHGTSMADTLKKTEAFHGALSLSNSEGT